MKLEFTPNALKCYQAIKRAAPEVAEKIKSLLKDTLQHPQTGLGEPTPLDGKFKGIWQRKISYNEFFSYAFNEETLIVTSIKADLPEVETTATQGFKLGEFSEDEYASVMGLMAESPAPRCSRMYGRRSSGNRSIIIMAKAHT